MWWWPLISVITPATSITISMHACMHSFNPSLFSADWGLATIKQDHVAEQIAAAGLTANASQTSSWLIGMGDAASVNDVSIEYCCSPPMVLHNSITIMVS